MAIRAYPSSWVPANSVATEPKLWPRFITPALLAGALVWSERAPVSSLEQLSAERATRATSRAGPTRIAVVWPAGGPDCYVAGARAARDVLNAGRAVGSWPAPIELVEVREASSSAPTPQRARRVARDTSIVAVIGHDGSDEAITASVTYDEAGLVYLAPNAMDQVLTRHMLERVFQTTPTDLDYASEILELLLSAPQRVARRRPELEHFREPAPDAGVRVGAETEAAEPLRIAMVYPRSDYGEHFLEAFQSLVRRDARARIVLEVPYELPDAVASDDTTRQRSVDDGQFAEQIALLGLDSRTLHPHGRAQGGRNSSGAERQQRPNYDVIVTPGAAPLALLLLTALRRFGIAAPVIGTDALDGTFRWGDLPAARDGNSTRPSSPEQLLSEIYIASIFRRAAPSGGGPVAVARVARGPQPDESCADFRHDRLGMAGYAQVRILDTAIQSAGTRSPQLIAVKLKSLRFEALGYELSFDERGNIIFQRDPWILRQLRCDDEEVCRFVSLAP